MCGESNRAGWDFKKSVGEDLQLKNNSRAVTWRMAKVLASVTRNFQSACYFVDNE